MLYRAGRNCHRRATFSKGTALSAPFNCNLLQPRYRVIGAACTPESLEDFSRNLFFTSFSSQEASKKFPSALRCQILNKSLYTRMSFYPHSAILKSAPTEQKLSRGFCLLACICHTASCAYHRNILCCEQKPHQRRQQRPQEPSYSRSGVGASVRSPDHFGKISQLSTRFLPMQLSGVPVSRSDPVLPAPDISYVA